MLKKLDLLQSLPHSRAKRLMNQWSHPMSVLLRAREHAAEILGGMSIRTSNYRRNVKYRSNSGQFRLRVKYLNSILSAVITHSYCYYFLYLGVTSAFPSQHRMSPLETFLELLTAKGKYSF